jgi:hypothetical protein
MNVEWTASCSGTNNTPVGNKGISRAGGAEIGNTLAFIFDIMSKA